jgi:two-component system NtrC family response regulator
MKKKQEACLSVDSRVSGPGARYELEVHEPNAGDLLRHLIIWVQLPGIEQRQLDIKLVGNLLTIKEGQPRALDLSGLQRSEIVGDSRALRACLDQVVLAANSDEGVLICGETGTGKELFARAVHQNSRRDGENFVVVDCRSIPESIAEKLLLGQPRKGRFGHCGLLPQANRGTLFLDEVGDLPHSTQNLFCKLLREHRYRPIGAVTEINVNFRLIAATNRNLEKLVEQGKFNPELLILLRPLLIEIPPLRERLGDIGQLTEFFLQLFCQAENLQPKVLSPEFMEMLKMYPWPGNVRELENSLGQALLAAKNKKTLFPKDLPAHIRVQVKKSAIDRKKEASEEPQEEPFFAGLFATDSPL